MCPETIPDSYIRQNIPTIDKKCIKKILCILICPFKAMNITENVWAQENRTKSVLNLMVLVSPFDSFLDYIGTIKNSIG